MGPPELEGLRVLVHPEPPHPPDVIEELYLVAALRDLDVTVSLKAPGRYRAYKYLGLYSAPRAGRRGYVWLNATMSPQRELEVFVHELAHDAYRRLGPIGQRLKTSRHLTWARADVINELTTDLASEIVVKALGVAKPLIKRRTRFQRWGLADRELVKARIEDDAARVAQALLDDVELVRAEMADDGVVVDFA